MRSNLKLVATGAFAAFLITAGAYAGPGAKPATTTQPTVSADSSSSAPDPVAALPSAQDSEKHMGGAEPSAHGYRQFPRAELFLGYSYLRSLPSPAAGNRMMWLNGGSTSLAFNFNRYLGIVGDFGGFDDSKLRVSAPINSTVDSDGTAFTYLAGPRLSFRRRRFTPFAQVLAGGIHASEVTLSSGCSGAGCMPLPAETKFAMTAGGGLDVRVAHHLALRLVQAEYLMTRFASTDTGASATQNDMRISTGIVFRFGGGRRAAPAAPAAALSYSCSVTPTAVFPGDSVAVSGTAVSLDAKRPPAYTWTADGGVVSGNSNSATIDTKNVAPGTYTVKGRVSEGSKLGESAECTASYTVNAPEAPPVACSARPSTVNPGETAVISASGVSPQNRPLTYTYNSTAGSINGTGATATFASAGASTGPVTVTCNVADDLGHTANATTTVTVAEPVAAVKPMATGLCVVHFDRDARRPARVDNEGKACLDEVAMNLQRNSDAKLAIVGNSAQNSARNKKIASQRAENTKAYLVSDKGIDASRITLYTGSQGANTATTTLVPAGASLDDAGYTPVK
jgi:opacity protein-like surface antigen/outer membrane protein OmpA-like peptidoglycan-associated protein